MAIRHLERTTVQEETEKYRRVQESEQARYRELFMQAPAAYVITDERSTIVEANRAAGVIFGLVSAKLCGRNIREFVRPDSRREFESGCARILAGSRVDDWELPFRTQSGGLMILSLAATQGAGEREDALLWVLHDVTERVRSEAALRHRASHDELTGLPGRDMFQDVLRVAMARATRDDATVALLNVDVDRFKQVNDTLGHPAGDHVLREVALRLKAASRATDVVGRISGDEFAVLLADLPPKDPTTNGDPRREPRSVVDRIDEFLRLPFIISDIEIHLTVSTGLAIFPTQANSAGDLIAQADARMYEAKRAHPKRTLLLATESPQMLARFAGLPASAPQAFIEPWPS